MSCLLFLATLAAAVPNPLGFNFNETPDIDKLMKANNISEAEAASQGNQSMSKENYLLIILVCSAFFNFVLVILYVRLRQLYYAEASESDSDKQNVYSK